MVMVILGRPLQALSPCPQFIGGGSLPYNLGRFRCVPYEVGDAPSLGVKDAYALTQLSQCLAIPHYVWIIRSSTKFTTWIVQSCRAIPCQRQGSVGHPLPSALSRVKLNVLPLPSVLLTPRVCP
jgi:hypothetical protein